MVRPMKISLRTLLTLTAACSIIVAACVWIADWHDRTDGYGPYHGEDTWPMALRELVANEPELKSEVTPFSLYHFIDQRSIWLLSSNSKIRKKIELSHTLERSTPNHPRSAELIDSLPDSWHVKKQNLNSWTWYTTPGYGVKHIEGLDLFLIIDNPDSGESIVLYEWIY